MVKDVVFPMVAHQMAVDCYIKQYLSPPQECKLNSRELQSGSLGLIFVRQINSPMPVV